MCLQCRKPGFNPWVGKISWRRERLSTPVFWSWEFQGLYNLWGHKESDMIEQLSLHFISHCRKVMLKILQARLQQCMNQEIPDVQAGFRKGRRTRDQIVNIHWIIQKARVFQKNIYFFFIDFTKAFDCVDHNKLWKILQKMKIPYLPPEKSPPGMTEYKKDGWHHWLNGKEFEQALGYGEGKPGVLQSMGLQRVRHD